MTESVKPPIEATAQPKNDGLWHAETMVAAKPGKSFAERLRALRSRVSSPAVASPETYGQAPNSRPDKIRQEDGTVVERNRLAIDRTPTPLDERIAAAVAPVVMTKDDVGVADGEHLVQDDGLLIGSQIAQVDIDDVALTNLDLRPAVLDDRVHGLDSLSLSPARSPEGNRAV